MGLNKKHEQIDVLENVPTSYREIIAGIIVKNQSNEILFPMHLIFYTLARIECYSVWCKLSEILMRSYNYLRVGMPLSK